jgi:hypothetical protein
MVNTATFVEPADDEYLDMAQTRSEIMRASGYGEDSTAHADETGSGTSAAAQNDAEAEVSQRKQRRLGERS